MANLQPTVLDGIDLEGFVQRLLGTHGRDSTLVVCSSKQGFLQELQATISQKAASSSEELEDQAKTETQPNASENASAKPNCPPPHWTAPTIRLLASAQNLKLAFCEDVTHLRAYLAAHAYRTTSALKEAIALDPQNEHPPLLAILNLIALHRPTSNFSAQGLNRTFSIAVDAAHKSGSKLLIAECQILHPPEEADGGAVINDEASVLKGNVWDEEVSILNVATKTFGAGERGWVGRTVQLKAIARRWCVFETWSTEHL